MPPRSLQSSLREGRGSGRPGGNLSLGPPSQQPQDPAPPQPLEADQAGDAGSGTGAGARWRFRLCFTEDGKFLGRQSPAPASHPVCHPPGGSQPPTASTWGTARASPTQGHAASPSLDTAQAPAPRLGGRIRGLAKLSQLRRQREAARAQQPGGDGERGWGAADLERGKESCAPQLPHTSPAAKAGPLTRGQSSSSRAWRAAPRSTPSHNGGNKGH